MSLLAYHQFELIYQNPGADVSVYRAYNQATHNPVVIKQLRCTSLSQANAAIAESLTQARLSHPHICQVYECFLQEEGSGYVAVLVVEMMESDLFKEITKRAEQQQYWNEREVVEHLRDMAGALAYAETQGVAHRDIKPHNIFINTEGRVKIGDFGSAAFSVERNLRTTLQGSPYFLSPELKQVYLNSLTGQVATHSYNPYLSDVYSLGLTVLYMALLEAPGVFAILEMLEVHTADILERFVQWPTLKYVLHYMLAVEPSQRVSFQHIADYCRSQLGGGIEPVLIEEQKERTEFAASRSLPVQPSRPPCLACQHPLPSDTSWQDSLESDLRNNSELLAQVCSKACLLELISDQPPRPLACMFDGKLLAQHPKSIRLNCQHGFCNQACLTKYLGFGRCNEDESVTLRCKVCHADYCEDQLRCFYKGNSQMREMVRLVRNNPKCQKCNTGGIEITLDCRHRLCLKCLSLLSPPKQRTRVICPVCCKSQVWNNS